MREEEADKVMNEEDKDTVLPFCGTARWAGWPVNLGRNVQNSHVKPRSTRC